MTKIKITIKLFSNKIMIGEFFPTAYFPRIPTLFVNQSFNKNPSISIYR